MFINGKFWINVLIFTFVGLGSVGHKGIDFMQIVIRNFIPLGVSWVLITSSLATFRPSNLLSIKKILFLIPLMIVCSSLMAIFVRAFIFDTEFIWTFYLVAIGVQILMIVMWRLLLFYIYANKLSDSGYN